MINWALVHLDGTRRSSAAWCFIFILPFFPQDAVAAVRFGRKERVGNQSSSKQSNTAALGCWYYGCTFPFTRGCVKDWFLVACVAWLGLRLLPQPQNRSVGVEGDCATTSRAGCARDVQTSMQR